MKLWTVQDAARELYIDEGFLRRTLTHTGIPGVERVGRQWLGEEKHWRAWDQTRPKRRKKQ